MKTRIFMLALIFVGALCSCRNDKKEALTALDIVKGRIQQSINSVFTPYDLIHSIRITLVTAPNEIWVMDEDGTVIYQEDSGMVGKNVFKDDPFSKFPDFQTACKTIAGAESGEVSYTYFTTRTTNAALKTALWKTMKMNDKSWKIIYALEL
jgi:hypothetical protein